MNLWEIIVDACNELEVSVPSDTSVPSLTEFIRWSNQAQIIISSKTNAIESVKTWSSVVNQRDYPVGSNLIRPLLLEFQENTNMMRCLEWKELDVFRRLNAVYLGTSNPNYWTFFSDKIQITPAVGTAAGSTTLNGTLTSTATIIIVVTSANFPQNGRVIIDSEVISYTGKTLTTLTGCERGIEGSIATSHTNGTTVTERDLVCHHVAKYIDRTMSIYNTGTAVFTYNSATVTGASTYFLANVYKNWQIGTGSNPTKWYTISEVSSGTTIILATIFGEATTSSTNYVIAPIPDLQSEYHHIISLYLKYRAKLKDEESQQASYYKFEFDKELQLCSEERLEKQISEYPIIQNDQLD